MPRFTFNFPELLDGVGLAPLAMGLFGISENPVECGKEDQAVDPHDQGKRALPDPGGLEKVHLAHSTGSGSGFFLGILPGGGAVLGSFVSYAMEKRISKHPEEFGKGAIEGVAAPEAANNSASTGASFPPDSGHPGQRGHGYFAGGSNDSQHYSRPHAGEGTSQLFWG